MKNGNYLSAISLYLIDLFHELLLYYLYIQSDSFRDFTGIVLNFVQIFLVICVKRSFFNFPS